MTLTTRKPTGKPPWPIVLLAGVEKSGKSYAAAAASASEHIGRTLWIGVGEDDPDYLGALPGARFEIVEHNGTYRGILNALDLAQEELEGDEKPGLIVLDSATRLWNLLSDEAQATANARAKRKGKGGDSDAQITMDLWNTAKDRWTHCIDMLRDHQGPSIVTARLTLTAVVDDKGQPTQAKDWKIEAHKSLPYDVGAIVELPAPGEAVLTGVRSLRIKDAQVAKRPFPGFTVEKLWAEMGLLDEEPGARQHAGVDSSVTDADQVRRQIIALVSERSDLEPSQITGWFQQVTGTPFESSTDVDALVSLYQRVKSSPQQDAPAAEVQA